MELTSFISLDTETTGLSFIEDRVIQFGAAVFINGQEVHQETFYIQSDVPNGGFAINGITDQQIAGGVSEAEAFRVISCIVDKRFNAKWMPRLVIYNAPFDLSFLANGFRRLDIPYNFKQIQVLDPLVMWRHLKPYTPGKLTYVSNALGIPIVNAHDAGADAAAAGHVYLKLRERYGILRNPYMNDVLNKWHWEWSAKMKTWATTQSKEMDIEPWPIREEWACFRHDGQSELFA